LRRRRLRTVTGTDLGSKRAARGGLGWSSRAGIYISSGLAKLLGTGEALLTSKSWPARTTGAWRSS